MTIIILSYVAIPFGYYRDWKVNDELSSSLLDERIFLNLNTLDAWTNTLDKLNAVILFFCWLKVIIPVSLPSGGLISKLFKI